MECDDKHRFNEALEVHEMLSKMDPSTKPGSFWYLLPLPWLKRWEFYTYYDLIREDPQTVMDTIAASAGSDDDARPHPGIIDYTQIIERVEDNILMDSKNSW